MQYWGLSSGGDRGDMMKKETIAKKKIENKEHIHSLHIWKRIKYKKNGREGIKSGMWENMKEEQKDEWKKKKKLSAISFSMKRL